MDESGAGVFFTDKSLDDLGYELYGIYKHDGKTKLIASGQVEAEGSDIYTAGFRLLPKFNSEFSGELEVAVQHWDDDDVDSDVSQMVFAGVTWTPEHAWKPSIAGNCIYLSKDWNPLWGRYPLWSELYVFVYGFGAWNNLIYPHADVAFSPWDGHKFRLTGGPMFAEANDMPNTTGKVRGYLGTVRWDFPLASGILAERDKLSGHITGEAFRPQCYYNFSDVAYFARWEISYKF